MYRNVHFTNVSSVYGGSRKWRRRWGIMHEHVHSRSQLSDTQVKLDLFLFHWATAGAKQRCCCHDNRLTRSIDLLGQSGANQRESKMLIVFQQKAKTCELLTPPTSACTVPLPVRLTPPQKLLMILIRKQQVTMMPSNQPHWNQCDHNIWEKSKHVLNMETGNCTHAVTVVSRLQAWWHSKTTATFWSLFNHQSCSWSHQRPSQAQPWKHKETKEKCSFVGSAHNQPCCPSVAVGGACPWGRCRTPPSRLSMTSPAVAEDAVSAATAFVVVITLAFRGRLAKLPRLLINTTTWKTAARVTRHHNRSHNLLMLYLCPDKTETYTSKISFPDVRCPQCRWTTPPSSRSFSSSAWSLGFVLPVTGDVTGVRRHTNPGAEPGWRHDFYINRLWACSTVTQWLHNFLVQL